MSKLDYFKARIEATMSPMDYKQASATAPEKYLLMDVRNAPPHVMKQKIAGATMLPLKELAERAEELNRDKVIVVYCWDVWCNMGAHAAVILLEKGFDVVELAGGIASWNALKLPTEPLAQDTWQGTG